MEFIRATVDLASVAAPITAPILLLVLRSAAVMAVFSPQFRDFRAGLTSANFFAECQLLFLGYTFGVAFLAPPVFSPLLSLLG